MNLEKFLRNLVLGEKNELKSHFLHVGFKAEDNSGSKSKNYPLNCTLEELAALRFLKRNPKATQEQVAKHLGRSERTIKSMIVRLTEKEYLIRKNGKRVGALQRVAQSLGILLQRPIGGVYVNVCPMNTIPAVRRIL